ncbi:hypothetical protein [Chitinophaga sp.]|uniref:hypothetical protein n=1 Tax=Chitinophaga sp. TaxID=1869181 RepID=UPI0031DB2BF1
MILIIKYKKRVRHNNEAPFFFVSIRVIMITISCRSTDANNREYGAKIDGNSTKELKAGPVGDPAKGKNATVTSTERVDMHSHPSGKRKVKFPDGGTGTASWVQPSSKQDMITQVGQGYVLGMGTQIIYIYTNKGVVAIIPISTFKK